jgi:hypothetical protein
MGFISTASPAAAAVQSLLQAPEAFGSSLLAVLVDHFGTEMLEWDPEALRDAVKAEFGVGLSPINEAKVNALVVTLTTDRFYQDYQVFNGVCEALTGDMPDFDQVDVATPEQMAWAITEVSLLDTDRQPEFGDEVRRYMGVALQEGGVYQPPDVLQIAIMPQVYDEVYKGLDGDAGMAQGFLAKQQADQQSIVGYIRENLKALVDQIDALPLQNRDQEAWSNFRRKAAAFSLTLPAD